MHYNTIKLLQMKFILFLISQLSTLILSNLKMSDALKQKH